MVLKLPSEKDNQSLLCTVWRQLKFNQSWLS